MLGSRLDSTVLYHGTVFFLVTSVPPNVVILICNSSISLVIHSSSRIVENLGAHVGCYWLDHKNHIDDLNCALQEWWQNCWKSLGYRNMPLPFLPNRCMMDTDDEVRDRATFYLNVLQQRQMALNATYIFNGQWEVGMWGHNTCLDLFYGDSHINWLL